MDVVGRSTNQRKGVLSSSSHSQIVPSGPLGTAQDLRNQTFRDLTEQTSLRANTTRFAQVNAPGLPAVERGPSVVSRRFPLHSYIARSFSFMHRIQIWSPGQRSLEKNWT